MNPVLSVRPRFRGGKLQRRQPTPFIPAEAGIQGPRTRPRNWVPAFEYVEQCVARMERSDIRGGSPHFAALNAGYRGNSTPS